ncbi:MAG: anti-sigma-F factor Fin [Halanaerobium sp.]|nr:anti-sigma-F factor Fin [Halanaerobium sp.]
MKVLYYCEYCNRLIDTLEIGQLDEAALGFDILSADERKELLAWSDNGQALFVKIICEDCEEELSSKDLATGNKLLFYQ